MTRTPNPYEALARFHKVNALVAAIERWSAKVGIDTRADAARLATLLEDWNEFEWAALAQLANVKPPSTTTVEHVIAKIRERGSKREQERIAAAAALEADPFLRCGGEWS